MEIDIKGYKVLIDDEDYEKVASLAWRRRGGNCNNYFMHVFPKNGNGKREAIYLHRFIMNAPIGMVVDHISGNTLDCRKVNLRICTNAENRRNQKKSKTNTSGFKGVYWYDIKKKWRAFIYKNSKRIDLGYFTCIRRAHEAYCEASKKYHGEFGRIE